MGCRAVGLWAEGYSSVSSDSTNATPVVLVVTSANAILVDLVALVALVVTGALVVTVALVVLVALVVTGALVVTVVLVA